MIMQNHYQKSLKIVATACILFACSSAAYATNSEADWDKDGLSDKLEKQIGSQMYLADTDGDGIDDKSEFGSGKTPRDTDKDGRIDILDLDDDGDGIPTVVEGKADTDKDHRPDYLDTDSDADGLSDGYEVRLTGKDSDDDGIDDLFDVDTTGGTDDNGDGIDDNIALIDSNQNGVPDIADKSSHHAHIARRTENKAEREEQQNKQQKLAAEKAKKAQEKTETQGQVNASKNTDTAKPVVVSAATLPMPKPAQKAAHRYAEKNSENKNVAAYGGSGYFYCANSGKIVTGVKGFVMTPPGKVKLLRDASQGDYKWSAEEPGIYAMQFQIPPGMSIVRGLAKGRRIVKEGDPDPLVLGGSENPGKKGYLMKPPGDAAWYTSFEVKDNAPRIINNNIPLSGNQCK